MKWIVILSFGALLSSCSQEPAPPSVYDGAKLVKICTDGTRIYKLIDGRFVAGGWGIDFLDNPETICAAR